MARIPAPSAPVRWILTIGIVGVLLGVGYYHYDQLKDEQASLLDSISQSEHTIQTFRDLDLQELESQVAELERTADSARARASTLSSRFREYTHSIETGEAFYEAAEKTNVTITELICAGPKTEDIGGMVFGYYTFDIASESVVPHELLNFLLEVTSVYESASIEWLSMSLPAPDDQGMITDNSTLSMQLKLHYLPEETA